MIEEPLKNEEALRSSESNLWVEAIDDEVEFLKKQSHIGSRRYLKAP